MATLKEHQAAMVDLLANGSGIPASASRLVHAMHDLINVLYVAFPNLPQTKDEDWINGRGTSLGLTPEVELNIKDIIRAVEANSPGLNDKALSKREKALKTDSLAKWPTPAEQRVKELTNTVGQLRAQVAKQRKEIAFLKMERNNAVAQLPEQAGCRKDDTQVCNHSGSATYYGKVLSCDKCGEDISGPTEVCKHDWYMDFIGPDKCRKCGESRK